MYLNHSTEMTNLNCKYAEDVLIPIAGLGGLRDDPEVQTKDGVHCLAQFLSVWDNSDDRYKEELDYSCHHKWGCSFSRIHSIWFGRIGNPGAYWYLIKLNRISEH